MLSQRTWSDQRIWRLHQWIDGLGLPYTCKTGARCRKDLSSLLMHFKESHHTLTHFLVCIVVISPERATGTNRSTTDMNIYVLLVSSIHHIAREVSPNIRDATSENQIFVSCPCFHPIPSWGLRKKGNLWTTYSREVCSCRFIFATLPLKKIPTSLKLIVFTRKRCTPFKQSL